MDCCAKGQIPTVELQELITKYQQGISDLVKKSKDHEQQIAAQKQKIMDMSITSCSDITCAITATPTCSAATFTVRYIIRPTAATVFAPVQISIITSFLCINSVFKNVLCNTDKICNSYQITKILG